MDQDVSFTASTTHINHLSDIFHAVLSINSQGLMIINAKGIIIYGENNHIMNCQAIIDTSLFNSFNLFFKDSDTSQSTQDLINDRELRFGIDLNLISYSFDSLGNNPKQHNGNHTNNKPTVCYLSYNGEGSPFTIEFEDNLMSESIEFLTFYLDISYPYDEPNSDENDDEGFELIVDYNNLEYELILKSDLFTNVLLDLSHINTEILYIYLSNFFSKELSFISKGPIGNLKLIYPNEKNILEKLEIHINESKVLSSFKFHNFFKIFKCVKLSNKCKITKGSNGVFSIQLICKDSNNNSYAGTLITINMLEIENEEVNTDILDKDFEEDDVQPIIPPKKRRIEINHDDAIEVPLFL